MKIHILSTINSETAPKLGAHLKNCQTGYDYPIDKCFIVNYGRKTKKANLNNKLIHNKLEQLLTLKDKGFNVPEILSCNPCGLRKAKKKTIRDFLPKNIFPIMARKIKHFRGNDIIFLKTRGSLWKRFKRSCKRDFFVKYIPKKSEFRVHVLGTEAPNICQKVPSKKATQFHPHVWCSSRGWTLVNYDGDKLKVLADVAIKAVKALNYDFGAVDIGLGKDNKFYIFEINSAPRLSRTRRRIYAKFFRQKEKEYKQD